MKKLNTLKDNRLDFSFYSKFKDAPIDPDVKIITETLEEWTGYQFECHNAIAFIGATGIAIRAIAPFVKSKLSDSPVICMDDAGMFVIPLLSGHVGGANEIAAVIADVIGSTPVITTSTDVNKKIAIDVFAKKNHFAIINKNGIAAVSSKVLKGIKINILVSERLKVDEESLERFSLGHRNMLNIVRRKEDADGMIDVWMGRKGEERPDALLYLIQKTYCLGIGCRRNKSHEDIEKFVSYYMREFSIRPYEIDSVASIDVKKDEEGIIKYAASLNVPFITYTADELNSLKGDFNDSEFVRKQVGCGNVSERAAYRAADETGRIILPKQAENGITLAIVRSEREIKFE